MRYTVFLDIWRVERSVCVWSSWLSRLTSSSVQRSRSLHYARASVCRPCTQPFRHLVYFHWNGIRCLVFSAKWHAASPVFLHCIWNYYLQQYRLFLFTNTGNVTQTKHNFTVNLNEYKFLSDDKFLHMIIVIFEIHILQGSVPTQLRCGGMFNNRVIANFQQNVAVKEFRKSVNIWRRYGQK